MPARKRHYIGHICTALRVDVRIIYAFLACFVLRNNWCIADIGKDETSNERYECVSIDCWTLYRSCHRDDTACLHGWWRGATRGRRDGGRVERVEGVGKVGKVGRIDRAGRVEGVGRVELQM